jgi:hypothetical protein
LGQNLLNNSFVEQIACSRMFGLCVLGREEDSASVKRATTGVW